ncbi:hypothetical protein [Hoeflea sp. TYP-13]|uniref:CBU_0592 family membrane protein n=1 Tax=Hoeflea sp. TYP-13 TaxID=3230023 RepID=UPI0034C6B88F
MLFDLTFIDWVGIVGSFLIAGAYLAVSRAWVSAERPAFHLINLGGAFMILVSLWYRPNAGAILIELLWMGIAILSLLRWARRR